MIGNFELVATVFIGLMSRINPLLRETSHLSSVRGSNVNGAELRTSFSFWADMTVARQSVGWTRETEPCCDWCPSVLLWLVGGWMDTLSDTRLHRWATASANSVCVWERERERTEACLSRLSIHLTHKISPLCNTHTHTHTLSLFISLSLSVVLVSLVSSAAIAIVRV